MIACYHAEITNQWTDDELHRKAALIPDAITKTILTKRNHLDLQLSVSGYVLLFQLIKYFNADVSLQDIVFNPYKRPGFINKEVDFNISHSGNRVICCATDKGKIGVDIEQIKPVAINLNDYLTPAEQQNIRAAQNPESELINYWTRKEAVVKAIGTGVFTPLLDIEITNDILNYQSVNYYIKPLMIDQGYKSHLACTLDQEITVKQIDWL